VICSRCGAPHGVDGIRFCGVHSWAYSDRIDDAVSLGWGREYGPPCRVVVTGGLCQRCAGLGLAPRVAEVPERKRAGKR